MKIPLRLHLLLSNLPGSLYLPELMVLINVPVLKGYRRHYFSFFIRRNKNTEKAELELTPSECESVPFSPVTSPSLLLPVFSNFFLSSKDFLLIYSTLKSDILPHNQFPSLLPESFQSMSNLTSSLFLSPMISSLTHNQNSVGVSSMEQWLSGLSDKFPRPYSWTVAKFYIHVA